MLLFNILCEQKNRSVPVREGAVKISCFPQARRNARGRG